MTDSPLHVPQDPTHPAVPAAEPVTTMVTRWLCRAWDGRDYEWPSEDLARDHVARTGEVLMRRTITTTVEDTPA